MLPLTALLLLALAAPASAAPVLDVNLLKPCYASDGETPAQRETVHVRATGFTPAAHVDLKIDGALIYHLQADIVGTVTANPPAPFQGTGERAFSLTLEELENTDNVASASLMVTNLSVILRPKRAKPSRRVRFSGRGFTKNAAIWAHYVFGGKVRKTIRLARRPAGVCGVFHARRRQIPIRKPATGDWILQVDQQRRYSPHPNSNAQPVIITVAESVKQP